MLWRGGNRIDVTIAQFADVRRFGTTRAIVLSERENLRHKPAAGRRVAIRTVAIFNVAMERGRSHRAIF